MIKLGRMCIRHRVWVVKCLQDSSIFFVNHQDDKDEYLQVINIRSEKVVLSIVLEYDMGEALVNAIDAMTKYIKEEIKG